MPKPGGKEHGEVDELIQQGKLYEREHNLKPGRRTFVS